MQKIHPLWALVIVALCLVAIPYVPEGLPRAGFGLLALVAGVGLWLFDRHLERRQSK